MKKEERKIRENEKIKTKNEERLKIGRGDTHISIETGERIRKNGEERRKVEKRGNEGERKKRIEN